MSFNHFSETYRSIMSKPKASLLEKTLPTMASKLKKSTDGLISVVLISGIPGSGKGRLAESLHKMLLNENLKSIFYVPNVENSINYNTEMFI